VVAADMNGDGLSKAYSSQSHYDQHVHTLTANVTVQADWEKMVDAAVTKFGGLDILVNNAGTSYKNKPTLEVTEAEFDKVMAVNVKSIFLSIPPAVEAMKKRGGGAVINIASIGAMRPRPGLVWYNASKGAVANASGHPRLTVLVTEWLILLRVYRQPKVSPPSLAKTRSASTPCALSFPARASSSSSSACRTRKRT
jgi:NAD(P)-dependent dehydrogenase (short-subunit alcohol dehydrogenase family)